MVLLSIKPPPVKPIPSSIVTAPFTVIRDDREADAGWAFQGIKERRVKKDYLVVVPTKERRLETGDYTIAGLEWLIAIERKSLGDLFGSLSAPRSDPDRRERFKAEHQRMADMIAAGGHACVIIEASLPDVYLNPPLESGLNPNSVLGTFHAWSIRFGVSWIWAGDRRGAELAAYGRLKACWEVLKDRRDVSEGQGLPLWQVFENERGEKGENGEKDSQANPEFPPSLF
jgi:hypothetical protein